MVTNVLSKLGTVIGQVTDCDTEVYRLATAIDDVMFSMDEHGYVYACYMAGVPQSQMRQSVKQDIYNLLRTKNRVILEGLREIKRDCANDVGSSTDVWILDQLISRTERMLGGA